MLADSAIVGHLGSAPLAGLTLGSTVVQTLVGFMVFLAYSTTPAVARAVGAGDTPGAFAAARNGLWVAAGLGLFFAVLLALTADPLLRALGAGGDVLTHATAYLLPSLAGLPGMLLVLAATGALRGFQDATTPLCCYHRRCPQRAAELGPGLPGRLGCGWLGGGDGGGAVGHGPGPDLRGGCADADARLGYRLFRLIGADARLAARPRRTGCCL